MFKKLLTSLFLTAIVGFGYAQCLPTYGNACTSGDFINNVTFNTISNLGTGCASPSANNYSNYTALTTNLQQSTSYTITVSPGPNWGQYFVAWIDFNQDNDFDDANEFFDIGYSAAGGTISNTIAIPSGVNGGNTTMRVLCHFGTAPITALQSCAAQTWGEVEDYTVNISASAAFEAATTSIDAPLTGCGLGMETVQATFANNGTAITDSLTVCYNVNNGAWNCDTLIGLAIASNGTYQHSFTDLADLSVAGDYFIDVFVSRPNDTISANDTILDYFMQSIPTITSVPYFEDFESGTGGWTASGTAGNWEHGVSNQGNGGCAAGDSMVWATGLTTVYNNNADAVLESPCIDFSSLIEDPLMTFDHIFNVEGFFENYFIETSTDAGITWNTLGAAGTGLNWYNQPANWDGDNGGWQKAGHILTGAAGSANYRIRFRLTSDGSVQREGISIDNINISASVPFIDATPTNLISPVSSCGLGSMEIVEGSFNNIGLDTLIGFDVCYTINNGITVCETLTDTILPGGSFTHQFATPADLSITAEYDVALIISASDLDICNDTLLISIINKPFITSYPYIQRFDGATPGGWEAQNGPVGTWELTTPAGGVINSAASGTNSWVTNATGFYNVNDNSSVNSPCFDFSTVDPNSWVAMNVWWEAENSWDGANLQTSVDSGATWTNVGVNGDPFNWYNDNSISGGPGGSQIGWTGDQNNNGSAGWVSAKHPLDASLIGEANVQFRVNFGSDGSVTREGFAFDDFAISVPPTINIGPDTATCGNYEIDLGLPGTYDWYIQDTASLVSTLVSSNTPTYSFPNTGSSDTTYNAILVYTDTFGLCGFDTAMLTLFPAPNNTLFDSTVCYDATVVYSVQASPNYAYIWNNGSTSDTAAYSYSTGGPVDVVVIEIFSGCIDSADATIYQTPAVSIADQSICLGDTAIFDAGVYSSYLWNNGDTTQTINVITAGQYYVTTLDSIGCSSSDSATLTVNFADLTLANDTTTCDSLTIDGTYTGATAYMWSTMETTSMIQVTSSGMYTLTVTDANGCMDTDTINVTINSANLDLGMDPTNCDNYTIDGTYTGATAYAWSTMETTPMINVTSTGNYSLMVTDLNGCMDIDTVLVTIDTLQVDLGMDVISCDSFTIDATITGATSYTWSTMDTTPTITVTTSGDYGVLVLDANGCSNTDTINVTINSANLDLGADTSNCVTYTIDGTYPGATAYMWSTMETTPMITVTTSGDYILTVTDANGCMDIDTVNITILPFDDASYSYTGFPLTVAQTYTFTTATATGNVGPTQALCDTEYTGTSLDGDVTVTGGIQFWTVPVTGTYEIQTFGGQGYGDFGGRGAHMTGEFDLIAGTTLKILVGQAAGPYLNFPAATYNHQFGGGGGSFVTDASNTPLIIAGGGGGNHGTSYLTQCDAQITTSGAAGLNATTIGAGGINGNGGLQATSADAGGGLLTDGTGTAGGDAFVNGGLGGIDEGTGGFGCGGGTSSWNNYRGGGGGGYSGGGGANNGGACCPAAGGGGSFNAGLNPVNIAGVQLGNGMVIINFNSVGNTIALCASDTNPIPTAFGPTGGTYSATPGISVNTTTGIIDLPASTPGVHTVTYTTNGTCPNSSDLIVTINAIEVDLGMNVASCDSFTIDGTTPNTASYLWSTMDTTATLKVTTSGTYFLDVVSNDGCVDSDTIVVTINNSDVNLGADVVTCDSYIINATTPNTASYLWSTTETTPSITVTTSGTYIVGVISNDGCISSDTINVTINSASLDLGPDAVSCDSYTINGTYPGATAYSWNTFEVTPFITVTSSGTYTLTVTDANGCQSTDNIQVTINSITPSLGADVTACETHTLDGSTAGAVSYLWSTGETTPMITVTNVGTFVYTLYVTDANGCQGSDDVQVTINTLNLDVTVFNIITDLYTIDGTTPNAASYLWSTGEVTPVIEVDLQDTYSLTVTDNNGCVKSVDVDLVQSFVGIEDLSETTEINLYPNPTSGEITLELSDLKDEGEVKIYNANGQLVKVKTLDNTTSVFDMKDSASGIYYMKIEINNAIEVRKFTLTK